MSAAGSDILLERMMSLHPKIIDLTLDRVWRLLDRLGHPERALPPVIHVAGTNGKGSTLAMLRAGLEGVGDSCHVYTSPHLVRFHERVRLSGEHAKGWRAIEQQIHCCLFRKAPASAWKHRHYTAAQRFQNMISPFVSSLAAAGVRVQRLNEEGLRQWLLPWLTPDVAGFARPRAYLKAAGALPPRA